jgi:hypothetical protein
MTLPVFITWNIEHSRGSYSSVPICNTQKHPKPRSLWDALGNVVVPRGHPTSKNCLWTFQDFEAGVSELRNYKPPGASNYHWLASCRPSDNGLWAREESECSDSTTTDSDAPLHFDCQPPRWRGFEDLKALIPDYDMKKIPAAWRARTRGFERVVEALGRRCVDANRSCVLFLQELDEHWFHVIEDMLRKKRGWPHCEFVAAFEESGEKGLEFDCAVLVLGAPNQWIKVLDRNGRGAAEDSVLLVPNARMFNFSVNVDGQTYYCMNVHLSGSSSASVARQLHALWTFADDHLKHHWLPVVIAGDFNISSSWGKNLMRPLLELCSDFALLSPDWILYFDGERTRDMETACVLPETCTFN